MSKKPETKIVFGSLNDRSFLRIEKENAVFGPPMSEITDWLVNEDTPTLVSEGELFLPESEIDTRIKNRIGSSAQQSEWDKAKEAFQKLRYN